MALHGSWSQADLTAHDVTKVFVELFPKFPYKNRLPRVFWLEEQVTSILLEAQSSQLLAGTHW